ncbi:hypothetical protein JS565_01540 [Salmonella enterica subsp. enterica serovar Senftenberg]|nr:hypothetical protein [Salmonella enterica subsp. enterica serovar Senftenberg]
MYDRLNKVTKQFTPVSPPKYAGPVLPALDSKQQQAIEKAQRQLELSGLQDWIRLESRRNSMHLI